MRNVIIKPSSLYFVIVSATFMNTVGFSYNAPFQYLMWNDIKTISAFIQDYATQDLIQTLKADLQKIMSLNVLTPTIPSYKRKTASTSSYISVSIRNAIITFIT